MFEVMIMVIMVTYDGAPGNTDDWGKKNIMN